MFDIDTYLNPWIPRPRLHVLPRPISHFLGYRPPDSKPNLIPTTTTFVLVSCLMGAFCGVAIIENVYFAIGQLDGHAVPIIVASFGAAAILEYNAIESPLAQPRNLVLGHVFSAAIGVGITKLFLLLSPDRFNELAWLAGALSVGVASVVMSLTKTVHPPAGATALLASTSAPITALGWWLLLLVFLGCMLMLASACLLNNINRRFPMYWWTAVDLAALHDYNRKHGDIETVAEAAEDDEKSSESGTQVGSERGEKTTAPQGYRGLGSDEAEHEIIISRGRIVVPDWFQPNEWESNVLHILQERLAAGTPDRRMIKIKGRRRE